MSIAVNSLNLSNAALRVLCTLHTWQVYHYAELPPSSKQFLHLVCVTLQSVLRTAYSSAPTHTILKRGNDIKRAQKHSGITNGNRDMKLAFLLSHPNQGINKQQQNSVLYF